MTRTSAILLAAVLLAGCDKPISEHWPEHTVTEAQRKLADDTVAEYKKAGIDAAARVQSYSAVGDFLNYGKTVNHRPSDTLKLDDQGVPMIFQAGRFFYSPGTVAIAALAEHGRYTVSKDPAKFFIMANKLLSMMGSDGALRYPYPYRHYTSIQSLAPGWTSGMDQGMALSVFARAYDVSKDKKWIKAGEKALKFMQTPFPLGPRSNLADLDPSLKGKLFYLEYYTAPNSYTLNGYMFALLGLYDWSTVAGSSEAAGYFEQGIDTLTHILPYYDMGSFSAYDLTYITYSKQPFLIPRKPHLVPRYHAMHIAQLLALWSVTNNQTLKATAEKWQSYVQ